MLNAAGLPEFLRRRTNSSSSTVPAEEEFLQEIASVIPKNIVAQRLKFLEKGSPASSTSSLSESNQNNPNINLPQGGAGGDKKNIVQKIHINKNTFHLPVCHFHCFPGANYCHH